MPRAEIIRRVLAQREAVNRRLSEQKGRQGFKQRPSLTNPSK
jgi:hypothetical protein